LDHARHAFSIEMTSREHVKRISVSDNSRYPTVFEDELGELEGFRLIEGLMLEVKGINGVLRIDITADEFERHCKADSFT